MNFWKILYMAADNAGIPTTHIGPKLGLSREYVATGKSKGIDPSTTTAARLLSACGYVLAVLPVDSLPPGALVITGGDTSNQGAS